MREAEAEKLAAAVAAGDRRALARAITLVESTRADHRRSAEAVLAALPKAPADSIRLGISGAPGVGKSTFIDSFGQHLTGAGHRVAVLAVDPSSGRTGGSILGDKTRMPGLARDAAAFIRPSPSGGRLGGVARRSREAIRLVEAAGYDVVIVETVGVGQSETAVAEMVDLFLLLLAPGGGDELQGIKRGIMELADLVVVNKAGGALADAARHAASDYANALGLMRPKTPHWQAEVLTVSAREGTGIDAVWAAVGRYREAMAREGGLARQRQRQARGWFWSEVEAGLLEALQRDPEVAALVPALERAVLDGEKPAAAAARALIEGFLAARRGGGGP